MRISPKGLEFIKQQNPCVLYAHQDYYDQIGKWDKPEIGYGYNIDVKLGDFHISSNGKRRCSDTNKITAEEANKILLNNIYRFENAVRKSFEGVELTQNMYDALVSVAYSCGGSFNKNLVTTIKKNPASKTTKSTFLKHRTANIYILEQQREKEWALFSTEGGDKEKLGGVVEGAPFDTATKDFINNDENAWNGGINPTPDKEETAKEETAKKEETSNTNTEEDSTEVALKSLIKSQCESVSIPGLDADSILQNLAKKSPQMAAIIESSQKVIEKVKANKAEIDEKYDKTDPEDQKIMDALKATFDEEIENLKKQQVDAVKEFIEEHRKTVETKIAVIKISFKNINDGTQELLNTVSSALSSIPLPSFIGTGSPNPAKSVAEFITIKHQLKAQIAPILSNAITLLTAAQEIMFAIPSPITKVIDTIAKVQSTIDSIPG